MFYTAPFCLFSIFLELVNFFLIKDIFFSSVIAGDLFVVWHLWIWKLGVFLSVFFSLTSHCMLSLFTDGIGWFTIMVVSTKPVDMLLEIRGRACRERMNACSLFCLDIILTLNLFMDLTIRVSSFLSPKLSQNDKTHSTKAPEAFFVKSMKNILEAPLVILYPEY